MKIYTLDIRINQSIFLLYNLETINNLIDYFCKKATTCKFLIVCSFLVGHIICTGQNDKNQVNLDKVIEMENTAGDILNIKRFGNQGETLILIHGLGSNSKAWQKLTPYLENEFIIYTVDLPKYLDREDKSLVSIKEYAKLLGRFISELNVNKAHLVGHSMGGQIAINLTIEQPDIIASLSLLAPAGFEQFSKSDKDWFNTWVTKKYYLSLTDEAISKSFDINFYGSKLPADANFMLEDRLALKIDSVRYSRYLDYVVQSVNSMLEQTVYEGLPEIKVPTIVLFGSDDLLIPNKILHPQLTVEDILNISQNIPDSEKHLISQAGHFMQWDKPVVIAKHLSTFFHKNFTNE